MSAVEPVAAGRPVIRHVGEDRLRVEVGGRCFEIAALCPHRKGLLVHGYLNPRTLRITCPLHHSAFDLATGRRLAGPAECDLAAAELEG